MRLKPLIPLFLLTFILPACNWVPLSTQGEKVRLLEPSEVTTCRQKGKTTVSVRYKIAGVPRKEKTIQKELHALARNSAPDLGGDTIVAASPPQQGKQTFLVYKCVNPDG